MKYRGIITALVAVVLVSGLVVAVMAQPGPRRGPGGFGGPGGGGLPGLQQLDLTDAQKEQIKQINESHRAEFERLATQMRELREKVQSEVVTVLTAEQQAKLKELQAQRGQRRRQ
jgi:Spy/CpxP family protein refolding chaperone